MTRRLAAVAAAIIAFSAVCGARIPVPALLKYEGLTLRADVRVGANISDMIYATADSEVGDSRFDRVSGLSAGAGVTLGILHGVSVESGLCLTERGGWDKDILNNKYSSTWLQIPLLLTVSFGSPDTVRGYVQAGGYGAYGIGGKTVNEVSTYPFFGKTEVANPLDYGLSAGFGAVVVEHFRIGFSYEYGLRNISAGNIKKIASLNNETISIHIGYVF